MKSLAKFLLVLCLNFSASFSVYAQFQGPLPRHADFGARFSDPKPGSAGLEVMRVLPNSFASQLGLQEGDIVTFINDQLLDTPSAWGKIRQSLKGGEKANVIWFRNGVKMEGVSVLPPTPREKFDGVEVEYQSVWSPYGYNVQTIITKPDHLEGKIPGIFLVRWLSCSPVEEPVGRKGGTEYFLQQLIEQSGAAVIRVEKPGLGDSEGPPCRDVDFLEELAAHRAAFKSFSQLEYIDPENIIVLGLSNGGGYAPLVPDDYPVAGYAIMGGWTKTWFEHMLDIERRRFALEGEQPAEVSDRMKKVEEFYVDYLIKKRIPKDILAEKPHLQGAWEFDPAHQYGIPAAYFQQLQDLNLAQAWNKVNTPTLVMYGEYDWIMSRSDHEMIAKWINQKKPGMGQFELLPGTDHSFHIFKSPQEAFDDYWAGRYDSSIGKVFLNWMKGVLK